MKKEESRYLPSFVRRLKAVLLWITHGADHCLWLFTPEEWEKYKATVMGKFSPFDPRSRLVVRNFISPGNDVEFDKSGRLSIPQELRNYADLSKDCVILGVDKYLELWDRESYQKYLSDNADTFDAAAAEFGAITI
jgi:Uncharacterized protein conserved in bacteria